MLMKNILPKNSMLIRFTILLIVALLIPFSVFLSITSKNINIIETENANQYLSSNLQVVSSTIDGILTNAEYYHISLVLNTEFVHAMKKLKSYDRKDPYSDYLQTKIIKSRLSDTTIMNQYIDSAYAYSYLSNRIFTTKVSWNEAFNHYEEGSSLWLLTYQAKRDFTSPWLITNSIEDNSLMLSSYREIKELDTPLYGLVSLNIDAMDIRSILQDIDSGLESYCFVTDNAGRYIGAEEQVPDSVYHTILQTMYDGQNSIAPNAYDHLQRITIDNQAYFAASLLSEYSNFTYIIASPARNVETSSPLLGNLHVMFIASTLLIFVIFVLITYWYFYTPIHDLFSHMHKVQKGDFQTRLPKAASYEIGYINENFNTMASNLQKLINENYINQLSSKEAQLKSIQNQLNAHFLYNTLDTIHWKARLEHAPETCKMIFALAKFYRVSLSSGQEFIPIRDILEMIENYLQIQKIRMEERFVYQIEYEECLLDYTVLKYLFQPIVENALLHGSLNLPHQEHILIRFYRQVDQDDTYLVFQVRDDGVGMAQFALERLLGELDGNTASTENSFALKTLQTQLLSQYGSSSALHIESKEQNGCFVWFKLPLQALKSKSDI
ncbi:histidine kinase [Lachnospiraceae bacterium ZAX-1]